ncbi:MAG: DUF2818 family protein [Aquabacterium sp.]|nr:DUF2818 family protein [Aquabacterium sp.]
MSSTIQVWALLLVGAVAANLPFLTERIAIVGPQRNPKSLGWRLLELLVLALLMIGLGTLIEVRIGQRHPQGWAFYAAALSLFVTFAFPGFVWRYLRRRPLPNP